MILTTILAYNSRILNTGSQTVFILELMLLFFIVKFKLIISFDKKSEYEMKSSLLEENLLLQINHLLQVKNVLNTEK